MENNIKQIQKEIEILKLRNKGFSNKSVTNIQLNNTINEIKNTIKEIEANEPR